MQNWINTMGMVAAIVLPLWNIPLIVKIVKRRSSRDLSLGWALGVWVCLLMMAPSGFSSADPVWRTFNMVNLVLFSGVVFVTWKYQ
ncbi:MAG TPA: hypothetical protein VI749_00780 [Candidatus Omnitrophota bacterium]|nr:hypothetical protein [Candidatus Omnitrophota bacterium]